MKKIILLCVVALGLSFSASAQKIALKNNLIYDVTLTPNLGLEFGLNDKLTLDLVGGWNPFTFKDGKKFKHWLVQPEIRWWTCERFNGLFLGFHLHGGVFNVAGLDLPFGAFSTLENSRYEGHFYGAGVSVGNHWPLGKRWGLEASIGLGYAYMKYDKFNCVKCSPKMKSDDYNYWGVTKANVSFLYFFR